MRQMHSTCRLLIDVTFAPSTRHQQFQLGLTLLSGPRLSHLIAASGRDTRRKWAARSLEWPRKAPFAGTCLSANSRTNQGMAAHNIPTGPLFFLCSFTFQLCSSAQGFTSYLGNLPRKPVHQYCTACRTEMASWVVRLFGNSYRHPTATTCSRWSHK